MSLADVVPERLQDPRLTALQTANRIRADRANLKRDLMEGTESIHNLLWEPPDFIQNMRVYDLIRAVPSYGTVKAAKMLSQCQIPQHKIIGRMTDRQRMAILDHLNGTS